jgi:metal-responsive CopG/Arc/MetJ family transcriptional regulator
MGAKHMERVTLSLPKSLASDLTYMSRRMGMSRSALVGQLLAEAPYLAEVMRQLPEAGATEDDVIRARGASVALVNQRVADFRELIADFNQEAGRG